MRGIIPTPTSVPHALTLITLFAILGFMVIVAGRFVGGMENIVKANSR